MFLVLRKTLESGRTPPPPPRHSEAAGQHDGMAWHPPEPDQIDGMPLASTERNPEPPSCRSLTKPTETPEGSEVNSC